MKLLGLERISFIDALLIFIILNLIVVYIYQVLDDECGNGSNSGICKLLGMDNNKSNSINIANSNNKFNNVSGISGNSLNNENNLIGKNNKLRLLMNDKGPEVGFHQHFKPHMPELGWRDFYLRLNGGISGVGELNPINGKSGSTSFNNIITRKYLDQLEATDNVYSKVDY
jgi:hypothetical protein